MNESTLRPADVDLQSLGIQELHERLEFSPLLTGGVDAAQNTTCCTCKIGPYDPTNEPWDPFYNA